MLFNSFAFAVFFPVVTAAFFLLPHKWRWLMLLAASCIFYMFFIPAYLLILLFTISVDYFAGILIERSEGAARKRFLLLSIIANVAALGFFKYFNFVNGNLIQLAHFLDWNYPIHNLGIILPIGLSFHTFQSMSYTIEVYRGKYPAEKHYGILALYVMFYPQLVAGPIERPQNLLPQFRQEKHFDYDRAKSGLKLMAWGFFKKMVIADRLAPYVNTAYGAPHDQYGLTMLVATLFFAVQIYCDFSGYSDIAIGAARVMGFKLMTNFNVPYMSKTIKEFWSRWHISLSTWFKDYLYFPLGGNRVSRGRNYLNILIVFLVSGIWHGANWTFVVWGALHGLYQVATIMALSLSNRFTGLQRLNRFPRVTRGAQVLLTFSLVTFAWIFFRADSISTALYIIKVIATNTRLNLTQIQSAALVFTNDNSSLAAFLTAMALIAFFVCAELWGKKLLQRTRDYQSLKPVRKMAWAALILLVLFMGQFSGNNSFIYFQF